MCKYRLRPEFLGAVFLARLLPLPKLRKYIIETIQIMKRTLSYLLTASSIFLIAPTFADDHAVSPEKPTSAPTEKVDAETPKSGELSFPKSGETRMIEHDEVVRVTKEHGAEYLVLNYWATWCAPCVKELPYFEQASKELAEQNIKVVGFSMDYDVEPERWEAMTLSTLKRRGVTFSNFVLNVDSSETFPFFSDEWTGALPATFIYDSEGNKVAEHLSDFPSSEELMEFIKESTKQKEASSETSESSPSDHS